MRDMASGMVPVTTDWSELGEEAPERDELLRLVRPGGPRRRPSADEADPPADLPSLLDE